MAESLVELVRVLRAALVSFDPGLYSGEDCAVLVEELAAVEKVSGFARVRAAARAGECGAHRERGFSDVADWMARATGLTAGSAKAALETAAALESQPEAKAALQAGELSFAQAQELVKTEAEVPGSTAGLLNVAKSQSLRTLKEQARDRRLRAIDPEDLHALQHARMYHRHWATALGNIAYAGELPPELGIPFVNQLDAETDRLWLKAHRDAERQQAAGQQTLAGAAKAAATDSADDMRLGGAGTGAGANHWPINRSATKGGSGGAGSAAHRSGDKAAGDPGPDAGGSGARGSGAGGSAAGGSGAKVEVRRSALAAQAFVRMIENGGGKGKANRADLVIVCDLRAWRRGHAHEGEPCHIVGGGPIPVSVVKELGRDTFLKAVLHDGTEIHTIARFGRRWPAVLRTALDLGGPPDFNGRVCAAPGCDRRYHLQDDHIDPVANGGLTSYINNQGLCPPDHRIKTEQDRKAGLLRRPKPRGPDPKRAGPNRDQPRPRLL